jgi:flavin-dependent dehydrogenase
MSQTKHFDLIFLGAGLASGTVARFLKLKHPDLRILILEKKPDTNHSPGESTVGVAGMFFIRDLGLSTYLYLNHLPKNGLRYFFTPEDLTHYPNLEISDCSEIGSNLMPIFPTFQVDRKRLDKDLWHMNEKLGITTLYGVSFADSDVSFGSGNDSHTISYQYDNQTFLASARWMIQAQGRRSTTFAKIFPATLDTEHLTAGAWGRYENVKDIDSLGNDQFRSRVGYTSRYLSTNHFMGRGYWIWAIPIARGLVSFGVVYDKVELGRDLCSSEAMNEFFRQHPLVSKLLDGATQIDFQFGTDLAHRASAYCSPDRLALIGDSLMFVDPFYSPGSDLIARQAWYLHHLISASDTDELKHRSQVLNDLIRLEFDSLKLLYCNQYPGFGSFELYNIKALWDFHSYTNRVLWNYFSGKAQDFEFCENEVKHQQRGLATTRAIQNGFISLCQWLDDSKMYDRKNLGQYSLRQNRFPIEEQMLSGNYSDDDSLLQHLHLCRLVIDELVNLRFQLNGGFSRQFLHDNLLFNTMEKFELNQTWLSGFLNRLSARFFRQVGASDTNLLLTIEDLQKDLPHALVNASESIKSEAREVWNRPLANVVLRDMHGSKNLVRV